MCGAPGPGPGAAGGSRRPQPGGGSCAILGSLQLRLRDSETKRLELERKLFEYSKSDTYIAKINFIKLKKYLKEICERQKNAVLRNQEFLKEFDRVEAHIRTFTSSEALQKLKVQYEGEIKSMLSLQKNSMPIKGDKEDNDEQISKEGEIHSGAWAVCNAISVTLESCGEAVTRPLAESWHRRFLYDADGTQRGIVVGKGYGLCHYLEPTALLPTYILEAGFFNL